MRSCHIVYDETPVRESFPVPMTPYSFNLFDQMQFQKVVFKMRILNLQINSSFNQKQPLSLSLSLFLDFSIEKNVQNIEITVRMLTPITQNFRCKVLVSHRT